MFHFQLRSNASMKLNVVDFPKLESTEYQGKKDSSLQLSFYADCTIFFPFTFNTTQRDVKRVKPGSHLCDEHKQ